MSNNIENPNAFAFGYGTDNYDRCEPGMSLRDYFAAKCLNGLISNQNSLRAITDNSIDDKKGVDKISEFCYNMADSMLSQRLTPIKQNDE